jgi:STAS domain
LQKRGVVVAIAEPSASLQHELDRFGITEKVGRERIYSTVADARDAFHAQGGAT